MTSEFDVAIVGAGPAGSSAAIELARAGRSVVLLEKERFPRDKVCGEFLSPEAMDDLARWGVAARLAAEPVETIDRGRFFLAPGRAVEFPLPRPALGVSRRLLDTILAREAESAGAEVRFGCDVERIAGTPAEGFSIASAEERPLKARVVLAAWGRWSPLDRAFGRKFATRTRGRFFGWSRHDAGDSSHLAGRIHLHFFRGGYCGLSRVEGGVVNFAGVVAEKELRRRLGTAAEGGGGWERFLAALVDAEPSLRADLAPLHPVREVLGTPAVFFERHSPAFGGVLGIGDAAGSRDPFTGDGQATAIRSGVVAARTADAFLRGEITPGALERAHRETWKRAFRAPFTWDGIFRKALFSPVARRLLLPVAAPLVRLGIERTRVRPARTALD
ncbi:MAG TPA: NAD(P)/FAD-dependent oxidoreductase [Thermoanaerobaculia bacterium]|nr:NAD(P)/FAD-dependent oxidoreductase [Thermoanaerobaculia bacterium]